VQSWPSGTTSVNDFTHFPIKRLVPNNLQFSSFDHTFDKNLRMQKKVHYPSED
jgi:hypothetical protein